MAMWAVLDNHIFFAVFLNEREPFEDHQPKGTVTNVINRAETSPVTGTGRGDGCLVKHDCACTAGPVEVATWLETTDHWGAASFW